MLLTHSLWNSLKTSTSPPFVSHMALVTLCMTFTALSKPLLLSKQLLISLFPNTSFADLFKMLRVMLEIRIKKDPIQKRNKGFGSGFESGSETGSEINL
jgi:hypothetical protein